MILKQKKVLFLLFLFFNNSCSNNQKEKDNNNKVLSQNENISKEEDNGIKEILEYYGGVCHYSKGSKNNFKNDVNNFFEIEMSKSFVFDNFKDILSMPASNIAYLFYKNLNKEKNIYKEIMPVIILSNGEKINFSYESEKLEIVTKKFYYVDSVIQLMKEKKIDEIISRIDNKEIYKKQINEELRVKEAGSNKKIYFLPYGFRFFKTNELAEGLHISCVIVRNGLKEEFSIDFNLNNDKILFMQYKF
jgi:hypothetical protein